LVVLEPSNFEIADLLGLTPRIVGVDSSVPTYTPPPWQAAARHLHDIGSVLTSIPVEQVEALRPSLVLAAGGLHGIGALRALHIPVLTLEPESLAGVYHDLMLVGAATGRTATARRVVASMKHQVAALESEVAHAPSRPTVFYDLGGLYTAGPHSFLGNLIDDAGAVNIGARLSPKMWPQVTAEQVVAANPAVILIDAGTATPAQEDALPGFDAIRAVRTHHVLVVPQPSYLEQPSPGLVRGLAELIRLLHPGLGH
jgi:iron complex transport system substrate-binding protein